MWMIVLCVGDKEAIDDTVKQLQEKGFTMKIEENLTDYLSCNIEFRDGGKKAWLGQPHLIKNLKNSFGEMVKGLQKYLTPGTPGQGMIRPQEDVEKVPDEDHKAYRSGVGMLLYLVKHSRPDIANAVRELSKLMDGPTPAAMKELKRVIKFVLDTEEFGLKLEPTEPSIKDEMVLEVYSDSDWAGDKDTRVSVSGYVVFLQGVAISWKSKGQKSVTLSSSEAEYVALSEAAKEVKFVFQVLTSMGIKVATPIVIYVDNVGAIFMAENVTTSSRSKHVDTRYHYVREFVVDGFIKIVFVRTKDNKADIFTKNVSGVILQEHQGSYIGLKGGEEKRLALQEGC
jgi:hypothetical protein